MKHIIVVLHTLGVGGAERRLSSLANYIAERGYSVTILLLDNTVIAFPLRPEIQVVCLNPDAALQQTGDTRCTVFSMAHAPKTTALDKLKLKAAGLRGKTTGAVAEMELYFKQHYALPLRAYLRQFPDAVVASFMTIPNIATMMALAGLPNRVVFGECTDIATEYPQDSPFFALRKKYFLRAQAGLFQTETQKQFYDFLPDLKKYVIPNYIKADHLPNRYDGKRKNLIVNFCRLSRTKNIPLLLQAFSLLHKEYPSFQLMIYGEGECKEALMAQIADLELSGCAVIHDFDPAVHALVYDAAMFVSSSDREGISNSMLEAMTIGLPCVCTDCAGGGARMMIEDHENGLLVPMRDVHALYAAMKELIEDPALADKLSRNAVKIRDRLRPDVICAQMLAAILGENDTEGIQT